MRTPRHSHHPAAGKAFCVLTFVVLAGVARGEEGMVVLDWSAEAVGAEAPGWVNDVQVSQWGQGDVERTVVGEGTEPASPFADGRQGLHMKVAEQHGGAEGLVAVRPYGIAPMEGWADFEFALDEGNLAFRVINESAAPGPRFDSSAPGETLFTISFRPGNPVSLRIEPRAVEGEDEPRYVTLQSRAETWMRHVLRIAWDFSGDQPLVRFELDGEPLLNASFSPYELFVDPQAAGAGVDTFLISGEGFIGGITVSEE